MHRSGFPLAELSVTMVTFIQFRVLKVSIFAVCEKTVLMA